MDGKHVMMAMLMACLEYVPPVIRDELLSDAKLRSDFGLEVDAVLKFSTANVDFKSSKLFAAVRAAGAAPGHPHKLLDQMGNEWEVTANITKGNADLTIRSGARTMYASPFLLLTKNRKIRKKFFAHEADRINLPSVSTKHWGKMLEQRPLSEEEIGLLTAEVSHTPVAVAGLIRERLANGNISIEALVPRSLEYYERLVGRIEGQANIREYATGVSTGHIHKLLAWRTIDGVHQALLMGSHSAITDVIAKETITAAEFDELARWACESDPIARGVTLELATRRSCDKGRIGQNVRILAERFCGQAGKERCDPFAVLSAAFIMVDGQLGRTRLLASKPPFWRRLAAFAQAALITRCVLSAEQDLSNFIGWMQSVRSTEFVMQCYVDLRSEPRWLPEFANPRQLKEEIGGRVLFAAAHDENATDELGLRDILISDAPQSLKKRLDLFLVQLPGPLEGNIEPLKELEPDQIEQMRRDLAEPSPTVSSFTWMANAALLFKLPEDVLNLAADAIRRAQYRLSSNGKPETLQSCLVGLAVAAAANRSQRLADELFNVIRSYRRFFPDELSLDAAFRIGMTACASRADIADWSKCVGTLIADLGFGEITRDEAAVLYPLVINLCDLVPELWAACGPGIAAIEAVGHS